MLRSMEEAGTGLDHKHILQMPGEWAGTGLGFSHRDLCALSSLHSKSCHCVGYGLIWEREKEERARGFGLWSNANVCNLIIYCPQWKASKKTVCVSAHPFTCGKHMHVWMCQGTELLNQQSVCYRLLWVGLWNFNLLPKTLFLGSFPNKTYAFFFFFCLWTSCLQLIRMTIYLLWFRESLHGPQQPPKYIHFWPLSPTHLSFT